MTNLTDPIGGTWNCAGPLEPTKPLKVAAKPRSFGRVEFDQPETMPVNNTTSRGTYAGLELRPFTGRAGAMDAFQLKSMVGGKMVARRVGCGI